MSEDRTAETSSEVETDPEASAEPGPVGTGLIRAKVAQILTAKDLVINAGSSHGVHVGMQFVILNRNGKDIVDPVTGKVIGSVPVAKTIVKVVSVQDEMAIARTFRAATNAFAALSLMSGGKREETLRAGEATVVEELDEADSYVKRGDDAVEVDDPDDYLLPPF